ncbi:MAG: right-handed parallel beta-helix repeat-containing protein [Nanoarchaeota archaeon]
MRAKKRAVSGIVSSVLLVLITIVLGVIVYVFLRSNVWVPPVTCPSNAELMIEDYSCLPGNLLNITISNSGYHNIDGFILYLSNFSDKVASYPVRDMISPSRQVLVDATVNVTMNLGDIKEFIFNYSEYKYIRKVDIRPFIYEGQDIALCKPLDENIFCDNSEGVSCGNGNCDNGETIYSCSQDCCTVELSPGENVIYDAINDAPLGSSEGYDQYVICLNPGEPGDEYEEPLFGANSDYFWSDKNGITLVGFGGRAVIDLKGEDAINVHSQYITLENLEIKNAFTQGAIAKNNSFKFINNIVHDVGKDGLQLNAFSWSLVVNNTFYNTPEDAIACNGCRNAVISNNHVWKGIGTLAHTARAGIYIYDQIRDISDVDLNCNFIDEPNTGSGTLMAGIKIQRTIEESTTESRIFINNNYINNDIYYTVTRTGTQTGPIVVENPNTFTFEDNYCDQATSYCVDGGGNPYTCCNNPSSTPTSYDEWKAVCGNVGAY